MPTHGHGTDWSEDLIARLRALWAEGHSTTEIGRRLGVSKNAVVGKAHRLPLPPRPSPIHHGPGAPSNAAAPRRTRGPTLPALPARSCRQTVPVKQGRVLRCRWEQHTNEHRPASPVTAAMPPKLGNTPCCWPLGEPGRPGFRLCDARAVQGKPYCPEHDELAYVRPRVPRPDLVLSEGFDPDA